MNKIKLNVKKKNKGGGEIMVGPLPGSSEDRREGDKHPVALLSGKGVTKPVCEPKSRGGASGSSH